MVHTATSPEWARWGHFSPFCFLIIEFRSSGSMVPSDLIDLGFIIITSRWRQQKPHLWQIIIRPPLIESIPYELIPDEDENSIRLTGEGRREPPMPLSAHAVMIERLPHKNF